MISDRKKVMLEYNKNYIILALDCILKNSKKTISISEIERRDRNNSLKRKNKTHKTLERALVVRIVNDRLYFIIIFHFIYFFFYLKIRV